MYGLNGFAVLAFTAINYFSVRLAKKRTVFEKDNLYTFNIFSAFKQHKIHLYISVCFAYFKNTC